MARFLVPSPLPSQAEDRRASRLILLLVGLLLIVGIARGAVVVEQGRDRLVTDIAPG